MSSDDCIRLAFAAVTRMDRWMRDVVRGFRGSSVADRRSFAVELGYHLYNGTCPCGLECCKRRHSIAAHNPEQMGVPLFVEQAVIGSSGLQANSVTQGMFYRLILRVEYGMLVALVELNRCVDPECPQQVYEAERCPGDRCPSVFTPQDTEVIAQERLFIQGVYLPVRRWRCGTHYFRQRLCRDGVHDANGGHDHCPWGGCPDGNPQHSQRGTALWVRCELGGDRPLGSPGGDPREPTDPTDPDALKRLAAFEEGARDWWDALDQATRDDLQAAFAKELSRSAASCDDPLMIADWLLSGQHSATTPSQRQPLRDAITRSFQARGL